jgi:phospholipase C
MSRRKLVVLALVAGTLSLLVFGGAAAAKKPPKKPHKPKKHHVVKKVKPLTPIQKLARVKHIVVIYEENHSFDNLYGGWEGVDGLANADAAHTTQVG